MRKYLVLWAFVVGCGSSNAPKSTQRSQPLPADAEFQAHASVLEAMEGGPLVVMTTLKYCGTRPRRIVDSSIYSSPFFDGTPEGWGWGLFVTRGTGLHSRTGEPSYRQINPGDEWSKVDYLHQRYVNISPGRVKLKIEWTIRSDTPPRAVIAHPKVPLDIDIQPADAKQLSRLRVRLQRRLNAAMQAGNAEAIRDIMNYLGPHSGLVPFAWRIIEQNPANHRTTGIWFVAYYSENHHETDLRLARLITQLNLSERHDLLQCWAHRGTPISSTAFYHLTNSADLWDRLLTYIYLSKLCDQHWANKLFADLPKLTQHVPRSQFIPLLRDLDDDQFAVREAATTRLASYGERVEAQLKDALKNPMSLEAKRRVRSILQQIEIAKKSPKWKPILDHLASGDYDKDAAVAVLRALAKGTPDTALTKAAIACLDKLSSPK
jgi:hypothetical protein